MTRLRLAAVGLGLLTLAACGPQQPPLSDPDIPAPSEPVDRVLEHPVRTGETLARIADMYYGDPQRAAMIAADNGVADVENLEAGSVLLLRFADGEYEQAQRRQTALRPFNRGVAAMEQGDLEGAERLFRLALQTVTELHEARYNLALVLMKRGRQVEAADLLAVLVRERSADADFGFALGNALFHQTRYLEAASAFNEVLTYHPDHRRATFGYARALHESGSRVEALAAWDRYLELDGGSSWAIEARRLRAELQGD